MLHVHHETLDAIRCIKQDGTRQKAIDVDFACEARPHLVRQCNGLTEICAWLLHIWNSLNFNGQF